MMAYGEAEVWLYVFLTSELNGSEKPASRPGHFASGEVTLCNH
jgi:hypothetical protein